MNQSGEIEFVLPLLLWLPMLLIWLGIFAWSLFLTLGSFGRDHSPVSLLVPGIPIAAFVGSWLLAPYVQLPQDYAHFRAMRPSYDAAVAKLPRNGHRFAEFGWGGLTFWSKGVVYDETDQTGLPFGRQSAAWKRRMRSTDLTCGGDGPVGEVFSFGGHYYLTAFGC